MNQLFLSHFFFFFCRGGRGGGVYMAWILVPWPRIKTGPTEVEVLSPNHWTTSTPVKLLSRFWLFVTLWTAASQAYLSMGILQARILEWFPCPPPGDCPDPGIKPMSLMSPAMADGFLPLVPPRKTNQGIPWINSLKWRANSDWHMPSFF